MTEVRYALVRVLTVFDPVGGEGQRVLVLGDGLRKAKTAHEEARRALGADTSASTEIIDMGILELDGDKVATLKLDGPA